jgi:myo-inositol 2-dehydrogenase / D-chiro-inositol 1-dehydrogenase
MLDGGRKPMSAETDRRNFILGALAAASSAGAAGAAEREIRMAFVGIGVRGTQLLGQALSQPNARVTAICDIDANARDRAQSLAKRDSPRSYSDYRAVLDLKDVDAVFVASPCDLHAPMAVACLEAGKFVYCEKPLGITPEQVDLVLKAARKSSVFLQIGQQLRYYPAIREAMRQIHQEKLLGRVLVVKAQRHSMPVTAEAERKRPAWYRDVRRSGDLIVENAIHNIDVCNWIADSRPVSAFGHGEKYFRTPMPAGTLMMDGFAVQYVYENETLLDYSQLYMHPRALKKLPGGQWFMIFGETGTVDLGQETAEFYAMAANAPQDLISPELKAQKENAMGDFLDCIRQRRQPYADIKIAAVAALTTIMGREAIYRKRMYTWKEMGVTV